MTISLLGIDVESGRIGGAISSSSPAVAARCLAVRAGVGAVASQSTADPRLRTRLLDLLAGGCSPQEAIDRVVAAEAGVEYRQLIVVDRQGRTAVFSDAQTLGTHAYAQGGRAVAAGNLLADTAVPEAMITAFEASAGTPLGDRLVAALRAGLSAGGEEGPVRSAGLLVADVVAWPVADLRVDWAEDPISDLASLWQLWKPQEEGYVFRALEPAAAPSFGVPGHRIAAHACPAPIRSTWRGVSACTTSNRSSGRRWNATPTTTSRAVVDAVSGRAEIWVDGASAAASTSRSRWPAARAACCSGGRRSGRRRPPARRASSGHAPSCERSWKSPSTSWVRRNPATSHGSHVGRRPSCGRAPPAGAAGGHEPVRFRWRIAAVREMGEGPLRGPI